MVYAESVRTFRSVGQTAVNALRIKLLFESRLIGSVIRVRRRIKPSSVLRFGVEEQVQ